MNVDGRVAIYDGVKSLHGAPVKATDLRGGAAMVVAAMAAEGTTTIGDVYHIERGYENMIEKLTKCGADITRKSFPD